MRRTLLSCLALSLLTPALLNSALAAQENVTLNVPGGTLAGTLQTPDKAAGHTPVVLILPGSGPTDRDGNSAAGPGGTYRKLADELAKAGIASLRVDKRGLGRSTVQDQREEALNFGQYVQDTRAWLAWLGAQKALGPVGVIGHSEGGLIALAALQAPTPARALVLLAAPGETMAGTIRRQLRQNPNNPPALVTEAGTILDSLEAGKPVATVSPLLMPLFRPSVQPYLMSVLTLDPVKLLAPLKLPTLIVQGDRDLQVTVQDAGRLAAVRRDAQLSVIPGMNHVLVPAPADLPGNFATYADPTLPLDPGFVKGLTAFLKDHLKP